MELILLTGLLEALTTFIDEEEKLGFLEQDVVDKFLAVEAMLNELIFGMTYKKEKPETQVHQAVELMYVPFLDEANDEFTHKAHQELEL